MSDYGTDDQRMMRDLEFEIVGLLKKFQPRFVFFEELVFDERKLRNGGFNAQTLISQASVIAAIQFVTMQHNIEAMQVKIAVWRKWLLGAANAPKWAVGKNTSSRDWLKDAAVKRVAELWNIYVKTDHEAEAIGIGHYGLSWASTDYKFTWKAETDRARQKRVRDDAVFKR